MRFVGNNVVALLLATLMTGAIFSTRAVGVQQGSTVTDAAGLLAERLGEDNGFAVSLLVGGDLHGNLDTCG